MHRFPAALMIAAVLGAAAPAAPAQGQTPAAGAYAASLLQFINAYRTQHGLPPLEAAPELMSLARAHSRHMAARGDISHDGFGQRFEQSGSATCVENVGWNHPDARSQFLGWRASPAHDAALLNPRIRRCGVAVEDAYVTFLACQ